MIQNIVIGKLLVEPESLFALDKEDWENVEKPITMFTEERFLPKLMVKTGVDLDWLQDWSHKLYLRINERSKKK